MVVCTVLLYGIYISCSNNIFLLKGNVNPFAFILLTIILPTKVSSTTHNYGCYFILYFQLIILIWIFNILYSKKKTIFLIKSWHVIKDHDFVLLSCEFWYDSFLSAVMQTVQYELYEITKFMKFVWLFRKNIFRTGQHLLMSFTRKNEFFLVI
jgi:hypothetical protein